MNIVEFLNARFDEGVAVATRIIQTRPNGLLVRPVPGSGQLWSVTGEGLLRDIESKRLMIEDLDYGGGEMGDARDHVIRRLASVYADHPDYDPEWAPVT
ncbi:DUF6221 family protein [Nocardiopsis dassonvillei]|uniref:DUF6221 family protein n=1 Tax=Nocardiopsis dassonvillei TaxID=2014 RepID=UPI0033D98824